MTGTPRESSQTPLRCLDLRRMLTGAATPRPDAMETHLSECEACRELAADRELASALEAAPASGEGSTIALEPLFDQLQAQLGGGSSGLLDALRDRAYQTRAMIGGGLATLIAVVVWLVAPRLDMAVYPMARMLFSLCVLGGAAFWTIAASLRPLYVKPSPRWLRLSLITLGGVALPFALASLPAAHEAHEASLGGVGSELWPAALACSGIGLAMALPLLGALWALDSRRHNALWRAMLAAAAAGLVANVGLQIHCPIVHAEHRMLGHASVALISLLLALLLWQVRRRERRPH